MQGERGSLLELQRYHHPLNGQSTRESVSSSTIAEEPEPADQEEEEAIEIESEDYFCENEVVPKSHITKIRQFQDKIMGVAPPQQPTGSRSKGGRRHTLCLSR